MSVVARLEGGPYDGAWEPLEDDLTSPDEVDAWRCPRCKNIHITGHELTRKLGVKNSLLYRYDRPRDDGALIYVYGELDFDHNSTRERDLVNA